VAAVAAVAVAVPWAAGRIAEVGGFGVVGVPAGELLALIEVASP